MLPIAAALSLIGMAVPASATGMLLLSKADREGLPRGTVALTAVDLLRIYGNKTWQWGTGGAYFDEDGRAFRARTFGETGETTARGVWRITDSGKLCFRANWKTGAEVQFSDTCFQHRQKDGDIYQRRLPDGEWYIFKHAETLETDEFTKLVSKDLVRVVSE
ncbi:DUF995 domain-containing protein [Devosia sp.]|uniref:DUF995 domain-containing protein n=1 Tax=Devosia sp. TaxID=1871048 RepID=UPI003A8FFC9D